MCWNIRSKFTFWSPFSKVAFNVTAQWGKSNTWRVVFQVLCSHKIVNNAAQVNEMNVTLGHACPWLWSEHAAVEINTKRNSLSHSLRSEVQSALYKSPCQWNSLGQLHVFLFFSPRLYYTLRSFINELAACLHCKKCPSFVSTAQ